MTYCVINSQGEAVPVDCETKRGVKSFATRNGYRRIGRISPYSWTVYAIEVKDNGKWRKEL